MQIPATGVRAVMISCLNKPPQKNLMSSFSELAAKLVVEPDSTLLCLGDIVKYRALYNIFDREIFIFDGDNPVGLIKKKDIHDFEIASKTISPKVRYYDCREYVQGRTSQLCSF